VTGSRRRRGEAGSGSVWVVVGALMVCATGVLVAAIAEVGVARHALATAADEAALAAANDLAAGAGAACERARSVSSAAGVRLERCSVDAAGRTVSVSVTRPASGLLSAAGLLRAQARAGVAPGSQRG
jgi:secretion/DNA translocation related TadE-like protein